MKQTIYRRHCLSSLTCHTNTLIWVKQYNVLMATYGSASNVGKAVSWILDGAVNPILYIPSNSSFFL